MSDEQKKKKPGRPAKVRTAVDKVVDEENQERLNMDQKILTVEEVGKKWKNFFDSTVASYSKGNTSAVTVVSKWNQLNPFLQNQRIKNLYSSAKSYDKTNISEFLSNPGSFEPQLRSLGWANSSAQQIYYNILRRSSDIPCYNYFVIPELFENVNEYSNNLFKNEDRLLHEWLNVFNIPNTFKTIALEVKREGKSSYIFRNKFVGDGNNKSVAFTTLQKLPTEWVKITGKSQLGYTVSFNMMYFLNIANSPEQFGDFMVNAWKDMVEKGVIEQKSNGIKSLNIEKSKNYYFEYNGKMHYSTIEITQRKGKEPNYLFWLQLPYDICYTFGSDNSQPWVAPDTMGLMLKLQELTDYGKLAGLIASTPLTAVLTGEIETIDNARAGKNEAKFDPQIIQGYQDMFNSVTSTNVEAWMWPAKNIKLQQLSSDVNSSEIISTATENFVESAGEGGLTITTSKPNVSQIVVARLLAASQQHYVTLQFEQVINFIIKHKLGFKYNWKINIWGDIFSLENDKKYLKEVVASGNIALLPKLMSAEGMSMRDTKAVVEYIKTFDFYKDFTTYTRQSQNEQKTKSETGTVGRPSIDIGDVTNEATAASKDAGTNTSDNRESLSKHCPLCGSDIYEDQEICDECLERLVEQQ